MSSKYFPWVYVHLLFELLQRIRIIDVDEGVFALNNCQGGLPCLGAFIEVSHFRLETELAYLGKRCPYAVIIKFSSQWH